MKAYKQDITCSRISLLTILSKLLNLHVSYMYMYMPIGLPAQAMGWLSLGLYVGLGLVVEHKPTKFLYTCMMSTVFDCAAGIPQTDNHRAPIVSITPISTASGGGGGVTSGHREGGDDVQETSSGLSFQLATLDR
jgi:hypothetical protein